MVIENKLDYGRLENKLASTIKYDFKITTNSGSPIVSAIPTSFKPKIAIITYGGCVHPVLESIDKLFYEYEILPCVIVLSQIYPMDIDGLEQLLKNLDYIFTVEEGNIDGGIGSEIIASLSEIPILAKKKYQRIGSYNIPIPSTKELEKEVLVNSQKIVNEVGRCYENS